MKELPETCDNISDYLYLANVYVAIQEKLYFKIKQIERYEYRWLTDSMFDECKQRLENTIGKECNTKPLIEHTIIRNSMETEHENIDNFLSQHFESHKKFRFTARVDLMTETTVWELKCTSKISIDHLLQVVIYAWIYRLTKPDEEKVFKIFNIKTGELLCLNATMEDLHTIIVALLKGKYTEQKRKNDDEFVLETTQ